MTWNFLIQNSLHFTIRFNISLWQMMFPYNFNYLYQGSYEHDYFDLLYIIYKMCFSISAIWCIRNTLSLKHEQNIFNKMINNGKNLVYDWLKFKLIETSAFLKKKNKEMGVGCQWLPIYFKLSWRWLFDHRLKNMSILKKNIKIIKSLARSYLYGSFVRRPRN